MAETVEQYRRKLEESDRVRRRSRAFLPYSEKLSIVMKLRLAAGGVRESLRNNIRQGRAERAKRQQPGER